MARKFLISITIYIILAFFSSLAYSAEEGLVSYWTFDDGKGDKAKDSGKAGNEGVIKGKSQWVQGKTGTALSFVKQDAIYVEVKNNPSLNIKEQITMCAWIKPASIYTGEDWKERNCVMAKRRAYYLDINEKGNLASYLYGVQPQEWLSGAIDMKKFMNKWVHVATTYDGKEHKLYVDGKLDVSVKKSGLISEVTDDFYIGWVDNNRYFDGTIDEVMLWSKALTADELSKSLSVDRNSKLASCWGRLKTLHP
ncbi:TPA: LamG domain-containing protein [Candidatus Poribacteria bacterium]|nr:LamG domain-containing protein [Candidatus Poribacteria bacterium]